jgi:hypothetical protein
VDRTAIPDEESIAAFRERVQGMIASVCAEEFTAKPLFMGCRGAITWICLRWGRGGVRFTGFQQYVQENDSVNVEVGLSV